MLNINWIDVLIVGVAGLMVTQGWYGGILRQIFSLVTFLGSLWLAVNFHAAVGGFLGEKFGVPLTWASVLGYLVVGTVAEAVLSELMIIVLAGLPDKWWKSKVNRWLGAVLSVIQGLAVMAFVLLVLLAVPVGGTVKNDIKESLIGGRLVQLAQKYGGNVKDSVNEAAAQAVSFLTVNPGTAEKLNLPIDPKNCSFSPNETVELQMINLVNTERQKTGAGTVVEDKAITAVARAYSLDMFSRNYFSHYSPEGHDVAYRLEKAGISFTLAGENLAYAPDLATAHQGLMNSPGHKRNILEPRFKKIGIGVIDGGVCGMMFTQNFVD